MRPTSRDEFTIAVICALPFEADAVEALFDETYDRLGQIYDKCERDDNIYVNGRLGHHNIVLCYLPRPGKVSAASVASGLLISYSGVQLALVVGICGGAPYGPGEKAIFLGDVIISDSVVEYDFGRQYPVRFERKTDIQETVRSPSREIRTLLVALKSSGSIVEFQNKVSTYSNALCQTDTRWRHPQIPDILYESSYRHNHYSKDSDASTTCPCFEGGSQDSICQRAVDKDCNRLGCDANRIRRRREGSAKAQPMVHIGKVASADIVMKSGEHRDLVIEKDGVIGFEMEGAGVWDNIPCIIIKGVCDYADSHKNKAWQNYAAAIGASAAKAFLAYGKVQPGRKDRQNEMVMQQDLDIKDIRSVLNRLNSKSQATIIFIWLAFLHVRQMLLVLQNRLPKEISPWPEIPAYLEDAHLRRFPIPLSLVETWEDFDMILEHKFRDMPGYRKVKSKSYILQDSLTQQEVNHGKNFRVCFRPGRRILMSIIFRHVQHEESSCPCCHAVNQDPGDAYVICRLCETQYRRIMDITEEDEPIIPSNPTKMSQIGLKANGKLPSIADFVEDEIADFKRVQIVAKSNGTWGEVVESTGTSLTSPTGSIQALAEIESISDEEESRRDEESETSSRYTHIQGIRGSDLDDQYGFDNVQSPIVSVKARVHSDGRVTLRRLTSEEAIATRESRRREPRISHISGSTASSLSVAENWRRVEEWKRQQVEQAQQDRQVAGTGVTVSAGASLIAPPSIFTVSESQSSHKPAPPTQPSPPSPPPLPVQHMQLETSSGFLNSADYLISPRTWFGTTPSESYADKRRRRRAERARERQEGHHFQVEFS